MAILRKHNSNGKAARLPMGELRVHFTSDGKVNYITGMQVSALEDGLRYISVKTQPGVVKAMIEAVSGDKTLVKEQVLDSNNNVVVIFSKPLQDIGVSVDDLLA